MPILFWGLGFAGTGWDRDLNLGLTMLKTETLPGQTIISLFNYQHYSSKNTNKGKCMGSTKPPVNALIKLPNNNDNKGCLV